MWTAEVVQFGTVLNPPAREESLNLSLCSCGDVLTACIICITLCNMYVCFDISISSPKTRRSTEHGCLTGMLCFELPYVQEGRS